MPDSPNDVIRRAVASLRAEAKRYREGDREERLRVAVADWLDTWHPYGLSDATIADDWAEEYGHAVAVAYAALGEERPDA